MTLDETLAIHLLARLAECSALHDAHERSRGIACGVVDELAPRVSFSARAQCCVRQSGAGGTSYRARPLAFF